MWLALTRCTLLQTALRLLSVVVESKGAEVSAAALERVWVGVMDARVRARPCVPALRRSPHGAQPVYEDAGVSTETAQLLAALAVRLAQAEPAAVLRHAVRAIVMLAGMFSSSQSVRAVRGCARVRVCEVLTPARWPRLVCDRRSPRPPHAPSTRCWRWRC